MPPQRPSRMSYSKESKAGGESVPRVVVERSELEAVRAPGGERGLALLGFKPLACLRDWHQLDHSTFLR